MAGKKRWRALLAAAVLLCLCGCGRFTGESGETDGEQYIIYYTNLEGTRLEERSYTPQSDSFDGIMTELLEQFQTPMDFEVDSAMPDGVEINQCTMGIDEIQVDFNGAYLGISNVQEVLLQAGLVKTLVQLPGVMRVRFTVDGQPLTDDDGYEVPAMDKNTFIDSRGEGINSYHYVTLNLYFANQAGDMVSRETRNVFYSSNLITEELIVEQIIRGPANDNLQPVADPSVTINSVDISRGICEIDLGSSFNQVPTGCTADPEICLYAFVNAICDACDVEGVRFAIDGESNVRFRDQVNLDQVFVRNADVIEAEGRETEPLTEIYLNPEGEETETAAPAAENQPEQVQPEQVQPETAREEETTGTTTADQSGLPGVDPALLRGSSL